MKGETGRALALLAGTALALLLFGAGLARAEGIGIYPTEISFDDALRGGDYFRTVGVVNDSDFQRVFSFKPGGEAGQWLSLVDMTDRTKVVDSVLVPPHSDGRVLLRLSVQPDVANGQYAGTVTVLGEAAPVELGGGAGAGVSVGGEISIEVKVTGTQNIAGSLIDVATSDTEVGLPLQVRTTIQNSGNVRIQPQIGLAVVTQATVVGQTTFATDPVYPQEIKTLISQWDSTNAATGDYVARVAVNFGGLDLGRRELPFKVFPRGTLTRQGVLDSLELVSQPKPGSAAKVIATFRNTGQIESRAAFVGELYRGSELIQGVTSPEKFVAKGDTGSLEVFLNIPKAGTYTLNGKVNFEGKESEVKELTFRVAGDSSLPIWLWVGVVAGVIVAAMAGRSLLRRRT